MPRFLTNIAVILLVSPEAPVIKMSIGFNLSDLVTVIEIAAKIRKGLDAPTEFTNIAAEYG